MGDDNLKYPELVAWARPEQPHPATNASSPFAEKASAFQENMNRVRALITAPAIIAAYTMLQGQTPIYESLDIGAKQVENYYGIPWAKSGIKNLFASAVVAGWTAFEVLAGDLWVEAVNRFPLLGVRALDAEPNPGDGDDERERRARKTVSVVAQRLLEKEFDLKRNLGDVLRETFPMTTFGRIASAYKAITRNQDAGKIVRDANLRALSSVRNALVHNAGNADLDFCEQMKRDARFSKIPEGQPVPLDGVTVAELLESAKVQGAKLIDFVDGWCAKL